MSQRLVSTRTWLKAWSGQWRKWPPKNGLLSVPFISRRLKSTNYSTGQCSPLCRRVFYLRSGSCLPALKLGRLGDTLNLRLAWNYTWNGAITCCGKRSTVLSAAGRRLISQAVSTTSSFALKYRLSLFQPTHRNRLLWIITTVVSTLTGRYAIAVRVMFQSEQIMLSWFAHHII